MHSVIQQVTQDIEERSRDLRDGYLSMVDDMGSTPVDRQQLSCGNLAHGFAACSSEDKSVIKAFGVNGPFGIAVRRATFLVDRNGTIADSVRADLNIRRHRAFIERAANAAPRGAVDVDDQRPG